MTSVCLAENLTDVHLIACFDGKFTSFFAHTALLAQMSTFLEGLFKSANADQVIIQLFRDLESFELTQNLNLLLICSSRAAHINWGFFSIFIYLEKSIFPKIFPKFEEKQQMSRKSKWAQNYS